MIPFILTKLFPPQLPGTIEDWRNSDHLHLPIWMQNRLYRLFS